MAWNELVERLLNPMLDGHRQICRDILQEALAMADSGFEVYEHLMWPVLGEVGRLYREGRISLTTEHMATRIVRVLADQLQAHLPRVEPTGKRLLIACSDVEEEELGAQMCADLFEARGWEVYFIGRGVPNDEIHALAGRLRPDILLVFGTRADGAPRVEQLIAQIREIGATPDTCFMIAGGVFAGADKAWQKIGADVVADSPAEACRLADHARPKKLETKRPATPPKRRRRRTPEAATTT